MPTAETTPQNQSRSDKLLRRSYRFLIAHAYFHNISTSGGSSGDGLIPIFYS